MPNMLLTGIQLKDVIVLEEHHANLTEDGWVIPEWLVYLREQVIKRDQAEKLLHVPAA